MTHASLSRHFSVLAAAASVAAAAGPAHAVLVPGGGPDSDGNLTEITYGADGLIVDLQPRLFFSDFNLAGPVPSTIGGSPLLKYDVAVSGAGSGTLTIDYRITNLSPTDSFGAMRFMVFASPDGNQTNFLDTVSESWGAANARDPVLREVALFTFDATTSIPARFVLNRNLTDTGPTGDCTTAAGCDAGAGLQWNAAGLGPNESFIVRVGLSDTGQTIAGASRSLSFAAVGDPATVLTFSGTGQVVAVPEPATWAMGLAGLSLLAGLVRRRSARA